MPTKIKMKTILAGPKWSAVAGQIVERPEDEAKMLVEAGAAEYHIDPQTEPIKIVECLVDQTPEPEIRTLPLDTIETATEPKETGPVKNPGTDFPGPGTQPRKRGRPRKLSGLPSDAN